MSFARGTAKTSIATPPRCRYFFPGRYPRGLTEAAEGAFSSAQYKKNHEWQAALGYVLLLLVLVLIWRFRTF